MFTLSSSSLHKDFTARPVCKKTDRPLVREIFRREFYGTASPSYPDEGLWEIYDSMEANETDVFGAYLVFFLHRPLFLVEIHPAVQMDLLSEQLGVPETIGIYCFFIAANDPMNLPGFRACIGSLLDTPGVDQLLTTTSHIRKEDPRVHILKHCGFIRLPQNRGKSDIHRCNSLSFAQFSGRYAHAY
jgi:hypothetical protein